METVIPIRNRPFVTYLILLWKRLYLKKRKFSLNSQLFGEGPGTLN